MNRIASVLVALAVAPAWVSAVFAQAPIPDTTNVEAAPRNTSSPTPAPYPNTVAAGPVMDADRAKIWNSPAMLRGRAWLQDYCSRSAKVTPEEAKQYMVELENMTPSQMKLWLLKFQEQEEMIQQQQAGFNMQRQAGVQQAVGVEKATQQAYANINQDETEKAQTAEQSIQQQQQFTQQMSLQKSADRDNAATMNSLPWGAAWANQTPWGPYAGYPMGGPGPVGAGPYAPGAGHYHVHYHIAPPAPAK